MVMLPGCASYERRQLYPPPPPPEEVAGEEKESAKDDVPPGDTASDAGYTPPPGISTIEPLPDTEGTEAELLTPPVAENLVRVLLFEQQPSQSVRIMGREAPVVFTDADGARQIVPAQAVAELKYVSGGRGVQFNGPGSSRISPRWEFRSEDGSPLAFIHPEEGWRSYKGSLHVHAGDGKLRIINYIDLESYVGSVVGSEMNFTNLEALKAQAVISRTYALWNSYLNSRAGDQEYDLTDHVMDQVYAGHHIEHPRFEQAAEATAGQVLTWSGGLILAAFHSTCGGHTSNNEDVWIGNALPYLRYASDGQSCSASPHYAWEFDLPKASLHTLFGIDSITGLETDNGGRVSEVIAQNGSRERRIGANAFRLRVNQRYGTFTLRSAHFEMLAENGSYRFTGRGMGHGVGLCQWGALGLAEAGWSYEDILRFYYKGVEITRLSSFERSGFHLARF